MALATSFKVEVVECHRANETSFTLVFLGFPEARLHVYRFLCRYFEFRLCRVFILAGV